MKIGQRAVWHDYKGVGFYMLTLTVAGRRPLFGQVVAPGAMVLSPAGHQVLEAWRAMPSFTPQLETSTLCVMPDHLHGILCVREPLARPLGAVVRGFKSGVTAALRKATGNPALTVWEDGFYDGVALEPASIQAWHRYILDNPRRLWLRRQHPDLFVRVNTLEHQRLPVLPDGRKWAGYGNLFLLDKPELVPVRVSRSATPDEIEHIASEVGARVSRGAVAVSPFISPGEQAVVAEIAVNNDGSSNKSSREIAVNNDGSSNKSSRERAVNNDGSGNKSSREIAVNNDGSGNKSGSYYGVAPLLARSPAAGHCCPASPRSPGGVIVLKHGGFPPLYKPSGLYFDLCVAGRLLVLSAFAYSSRKQPLTREQCLCMNGWCEMLARSRQ